MIKPKKSVQRVKAYAPPLEGRTGKLRLDFNENTIGASKKVAEAIGRLNAEYFAVYPEYDRFIKELAKYAKVKTNEILPTNGTDEAISVAINTYVDKGEEIILPVPTFAMFEVYAEIAGANLRKIPYNKDLSFPTEKVLKAISKKTKMVVLVNPNNPTGTRIEQKDIEKIVKKAKNCAVLVDEAYSQYLGESSKKLINKCKNVIVSQTFSKAFGLAGLRLGFIASCKENIANMTKVRSPYSVNSVAVKAAIAAIKDKAFVKKYVNEIEQSKKMLEAELKKLKIKKYPSSANFILADFGGKAKYVKKQLNKKGILVRPRADIPLLKGCIRIGIGTKKQTKQLINALRKIL